MSGLPDVLVVGLGMTGLSLARHWGGKAGTLKVMDTREAPPCLGTLLDEMPGVAFEQAPMERIVETAARHDVVALSPGVAAVSFANCGADVVGDVSCFFEALRQSGRGSLPLLVAVTGTNGKSTLVGLANHILRSAGRDSVAIGNIGVPVLDALAGWKRSDEWPEIAVVEVSSFQLETARELDTMVAVTLNVSEDHLDRHGSLAEYAMLKERIYGGARVAAINRSDIFCAAMKHSCPSEIGFAERAADAKHGDWLAEDAMPGVPPVLRRNGDRYELAEIDRVSFPLVNVLAALAVTEPFGLDTAGRIRAIGTFRPLPHRMSHVGTVGAVTFYDDSKATNVDAAIAAMRRFDDGLSVIIAGGDAKSQQFSRLAHAAHGRTAHFVLLGADADLIAQALDEEGVPSVRAQGMEEAVARAFSLAPDSGRVILTPACSSLDMYSGFAARGEDFAGSVRSLRESHGESNA